MYIVIDIPELLYKQITGKDMNIPYVETNILPYKEIIKKGIPLDKIRAEFINRYPKNYMGEPELGGASCVFSLNEVLDVIDKYKAESEEILKENKEEYRCN